MKEEFLLIERLTLQPIITIMDDKISPFPPLEKKEMAFAPESPDKSISSEE